MGMMSAATSEGTSFVPAAPQGAAAAAGTQPQGQDLLAEASDMTVDDLQMQLSRF